MAVYCGACGTSLSQSAKFCRACGSAQAAPAYSPPPTSPGGTAAFGAWQVRAPTALEVTAAVLAILGGAAICFVALYATIYLPLDNDYSVNYGNSPRLGDIVALVSGLAALAIGVLLISRRPGNLTATGIWLVVAGTPTLIVALLWAFPETFDLNLYPVPFYFAYVYFTDLGVVETSQGYISLPLVTACALVIAAGLAIASPSAARAAPGTTPR